MFDIHEVNTDMSVAARGYLLREGYPFTSITRLANVYDAIVVKYQQDVPCSSPRMVGSSRSLEERVWN